ncbi:hypothetical protein QRX60_32045 [Amycolatopsis mongoliensis]|uniref:Lipoprotein n=1 Tax=Amycolatopsis mongoliensis TaxID=715475 RepID=A0A9Y2NBN2_9PSEU|nr:hypothetical protein [Amycolatopsis sp. 4-36]WIX98681.1 hypothetical protein QRX60_32045 [Amycolatopsis sp. 4-36]
MRRVLATLTCLAAVITIGGCSSGGSTPQAPRSGEATGAGAPGTTAATPEAVTADPPTAFDAGAGVSLPTEAFSTNVGGGITARFLTLRDRTAYIVAPTGMTAVDVFTGKQQWAVPIEGEPGDPDNQRGPFVNTTGPRPPVVTEKLAAAAVPVSVPEQGTTPGYIALTVLAADVTTGKKAWQTDTKIASDDQYADAGNAVTKVVGVTDKAVIASYEKVVYGSTQGGKPIALDAKTGKDLSTEVGVEPYWVSKYAAIGLSDKRIPTAYPVKK